MDRIAISKQKNVHEITSERAGTGRHTPVTRGFTIGDITVSKYTQGKKTTINNKQEAALINEYWRIRGRDAGAIPVRREVLDVDENVKSIEYGVSIAHLGNGLPPRIRKTK